MAIHVEEMSTEVSASEGDIPLSHTQMEMLVEYVANRMEQKQMQTTQLKESTEIRNSVMSNW